MGKFLNRLIKSAATGHTHKNKKKRRRGQHKPKSAWKSRSSSTLKSKSPSKLPALHKLQQKQTDRILRASEKRSFEQKRDSQRRRDLAKKRRPKSLEHFKSQKFGDARQVKGFKSKLSILEVAYYRQQQSNEEEETFRDSYFAAYINKMSTINRSMEMNALIDKIGPLCASLPHVLLHKKAIFDGIIEFINNEAHQFILHDAVGLLLQLAKDIKHEFLPFVDDLLLFLSQMLEWRDANLKNMQTVFSAFSWLFKYLQKYMEIEDIKKYYKTYFMRFLANNKYYTRDFMAQIFATIFRSKIMLNYQLQKKHVQQQQQQQDQQQHLHVFNDNDKILLLRNDILSINMRDYLYDTKQLNNSNSTRKHLQIGLSVFLFQIVRGVLKGFHSKTVDMLPLMLNVLHRQRLHLDGDMVLDEGLANREKEEIQHQMKIFEEFVDLAAVYTNNNHCLAFFAPFYAVIHQHLSCMQKAAKPQQTNTANKNGTNNTRSNDAKKPDDEQQAGEGEEEAVDKQIIDEFVAASKAKQQQQQEDDENDNNDSDETDSNSNSILVEEYTFLSNLDYLNRLLKLFNIWLSHNVGEVVPKSASSNLIQLIADLTNKHWLHAVMNSDTNKDETATQEYIERVMNVIVSCCKIYMFKTNRKFRTTAQNAIKSLLLNCNDNLDIRLVSFMVDRLGATKFLLDTHMRQFMVQWIEKWSVKHKDEQNQNGQGMELFLDLMKKSKHRLSFDLKSDSDIVQKVQQALMAPLQQNADSTKTDEQDEQQEDEESADDDEEDIDMQQATEPESDEKDEKMDKEQIVQLLKEYNASNIGKITHAQSQQIQEYLPMIKHFPNQTQWIECLTNLVTVLMDFILQRDQERKQQHDDVQLIEDYRFALLNKLHNVLITLLLSHLSRSDLRKLHQLPQIILHLDTHWTKWFAIVTAHSCNSFVCDTSLHFMEFIESLHQTFKSTKNDTLSADLLKLKQNINTILSQDTFNKYYPLLLPLLSAANTQIRRNSIDIMCLFNPEIRYHHYDNYGSKLVRKPILSEIKDLFHDDWGPTLERDREQKIVHLISFAKGIDPSLYYMHETQKDILQKLKAKQAGIKLGDRDRSSATANNALNLAPNERMKAEMHDYQLQIVCHAVFGLFRVNYRPLWSHCIELLNVLSDRFPESLWMIYSRILTDLMQITHIRRDIAEHVNYRQRLLVSTDTKSSRPLQVLNFLFEQLNKNHPFVTGHIKDIIRLFLKFMDDQYHLAFPHEAIAGNYGQILDEQDEQTKIVKHYDWSGKRQCYKGEATKIRMSSKLKNFLTLFRDLNIDYRQALDTDTIRHLRDTFYRLLLLRDLDIQKMTLTSYARFYPQISQYYSSELAKETKHLLPKVRSTNDGEQQKETKKQKKAKQKKRHKHCSLKSLLSISTLKAGLVNFNMIKGDVRCVIDDNDRKYVVPVVIRVLYNKLFERQKYKVKATLTSRRVAILSYVSTLEENEIAAFLDILHHSFVQWNKHEEQQQQESNETDRQCSRFAPGFAAQYQYISIIRLWQKSAPMSMGPFLEHFSKYLTLIFKHSYRFFTDFNYRNSRQFSHDEQAMCRRNYKMCLEILRIFIEFYGESMTIASMLRDWMQCNKEYLTQILPEKRKNNKQTDIQPLWYLWISASNIVATANFFDLQWPFALIIECLNAAHLSPFTRKSCIQIIQNLIKNKDIMRPLFIRFGKALLQSMIHLLGVVSSNNNEQKPINLKKLRLPQSELDILVFLSDIVEDKTELQKLTDSLIPYLIKAKKSPNTVLSILGVLTKLISSVSNYQTWTDALIDILNFVDNKKGARQLLCKLLVSISEKAERDWQDSKTPNTVSWLKLVAPVLLDLNCIYIEEITKEVKTLNLRRLRAFDEIVTDLLPQFNYQQLKLIASTILFDIRGAGFSKRKEMDVVLQDAAMTTMKAIIEYDYVNHQHLQEADLEKLMDTFLNDIILANINDEKYRSRFMPLFAVICESRPDLNGNLGVLVTHSSVVKGSDFFSLIASNKPADQVQAMQTLCLFLRSNNDKYPTLNDRAIVILLPIIRQIVFMDGNLDNELRIAAMNVVSNMAQCACWIVYRWMIDRFMRDYKHDGHQRKINYRIIALECIMRIAKRFHFEVDCMQNLARLDEALLRRTHKQNIWESIDKKENASTESEKDESSQDKQHEDEDENESEQSEIESKSDNKDTNESMSETDDESESDDDDDLLDSDLFNDDSNEDPLDIQLFMYDHIMKPLMPELRVKGKIIQSEHVHILSRVARTVVYIAKYLPQSDFDEVFLAAISTSCQFLQSKIPARRDKARRVLIDILKSVGTKFFRYIVKEIEARTVWGRWKHVLGYTVCDILSEMHRCKCIEVGSLDYAAADMTNILLHDIAGAIGAEKILETRKYRGKEAGDSRAPEAFRIIGQYVTFNPHIHLMLFPVSEFATRAADQNDWRLKQIETVLESMKRGLLRNKSVVIDDLIAFSYRMITEQLELLNAGKSNVFGVENRNRLVQPHELRRGKLQNTPFLLAAPNRAALVSSTSAPKPSAILMIRFCLQLVLLIFNNSEWKQKISDYNIKQLELIPTLCLKVFNQCPSERVHILVLRIAIKLLPYKLSTNKAFADVVIEYALEAITRTNLKIRDVSLALLSRMIQHKELKLDDNMLDVILNYIRDHISHNVCPKGAINLLHCILDEKLKSPQIYDLMFEVHSNVTKLQSRSLTWHYSQCLTKFLMTYPLSDRAIKQHFEKIIGSLQHPFVMGRICALQLMETIISSFPVKVIDVYAMVMYMSLIQQLANESDSRVRKKIKFTLMYLLSQIEYDQFWQFWSMFEEWIKSDRFALSIAALQSGLSFLKQRKHMITSSNFKKLTRLLISNGLQAAKTQHTSAIRVKDYGQNAIWKPCYLSLVLMEEILNCAWRQQPELLCANNNNNNGATNNEFQQAFNDMIVLMDFPHRWIRIICCRILGWYLSIIGKEDLIAIEEHIQYDDDDQRPKEKRVRPQWIDADQDSIYALCKKLCVIMKDLYISKVLCQQVIKNLLYLTLVLHEKYLNSLKQQKDFEWIKQLKQRQQEVYRRKMEEQEMSKQELRAKRKKAKQETKEELARLRREKQAWFDEFEKDENTEEEEAKQEESLKQWLNDDDDDDDDDDVDVDVDKEDERTELQNQKQDEQNESKQDDNEKEEEDEEEQENTDLMIQQSSWIAADLQTETTSDLNLSQQHEQAPNWRVNEIFQFMTLRIQDWDTPLEIQYCILQWFAAVCIKFTPYDLRLYDYYIMTAVVYMLQRKNPSTAIDIARRMAEIEGKEVRPLTLRQQHRISTYEKCIDLSNDILQSLKQKIGDSLFLNKFYKIKKKRQRREQWRKQQRAGKRYIGDTRNSETEPKQKKRKLNDKEQAEDWVNFLWT